jgi:TrmH family RNA methyltransferase
MPGNSTLHSGLHGNSVTHNSMPGKSMSHSNITGKSMPCSNKPDIRYIAVSDSFAKGAGFEIIIKPCINRGIRVYNLADSLFESVSDTVNPQGILAVLGMKRVLLEDAALNEGILVILDGIRDPGNMGTIIRTADAAGCAGVVITDGCVDLFNPKVLRSTMGSIFHLPVLHCGNTKKAADICRMKGYTVYASQTEGAVSIYEADLSGNAAFVIGSEAEGVSGEVLDSSDVLIRIPMSGRAESLNAAVAAAVIIYEAVRQKGKAAGGPPDKAVHGIAGRKPYTEQSD